MKKSIFAVIAAVLVSTSAALADGYPSRASDGSYFLGRTSIECDVGDGTSITFFSPLSREITFNGNPVDIGYFAKDTNGEFLGVAQPSWDGARRVVIFKYTGTQGPKILEFPETTIHPVGKKGPVAFTYYENILENRTPKTITIECIRNQ